MISGGMIAGGLISGGQTGPAAAPSVPLPAVTAPAAPGASAPQGIQVTLGEDFWNGLTPEQKTTFLSGLNDANKASAEYPGKLLDGQNTFNEKYFGMLEKMLYGQVATGVLNTISDIWGKEVQRSIANNYFDSQVTMQDRQALAAENIAGKQLDWQTRAAESFDNQNELLYSRGGFAEQRERIHSETAIAMNESKERGKTERAALRGVDEAFGLDSRDSYGYGNPFAAA